jgi:hypothetical protein
MRIQRGRWTPRVGKGPEAASCQPAAKPRCTWSRTTRTFRHSIFPSPARCIPSRRSSWCKWIVRYKNRPRPLDLIAALLKPVEFQSSRGYESPLRRPNVRARRTLDGLRRRNGRLINVDCVVLPIIALSGETAGKLIHNGTSTVYDPRRRWTSQAKSIFPIQPLAREGSRGRRRRPRISAHPRKQTPTGRRLFHGASQPQAGTQPAGPWFMTSSASSSPAPARGRGPRRMLSAAGLALSSRRQRELGGTPRRIPRGRRAKPPPPSCYGSILPPRLHGRKRRRLGRLVPTSR